MRRNKCQIESVSNEKINSVPKQSNDLQNKTKNEKMSEDKENNTNDVSVTNLNLDERKHEKNYNKDGVSTLVAGTIKRPSRRRRSKFWYSRRSPSPHRQPTYLAKKMKMSRDANTTTTTSWTTTYFDHFGEKTTDSTAEIDGYSESGFTANRTIERPPRPRRRCGQVSYCPPRSPSPDSQLTYLSKKRKTKKSIEYDTTSKEQIKNKLSRDPNTTTTTSWTTSTFKHFGQKTTDSTASIVLDKLKYDVRIDPTVIDRYTDSGFTLAGSTPESPKTKKERIDIISRQCRLHPANKKYNQGPIENPPLITPGKIVGFTPGGQRHEVDLNFDRPTWFNSEYARMQWDCATKINVRRMFHELETGTFLPDSLDPNIERKYFAEQEIATKQASDHYDGIVKASCSYLKEPKASLLSEEDKEHMQLLETENELIELNQYTVVRIQDFAGEIAQKLRKALDLNLTPLMIKKNPVILDTLETLATKYIHLEVVLAARALLDKIRRLFQVPEKQEFREYIAQEVEKLKEKTKNMSVYDIITMTQEPPDYSSEDEESFLCTIPSLEPNAQEQDLVEAEDNWVPVENGDVRVDLRSNSSNSGNGSMSNSHYTSEEDDGDGDYRSSAEEPEDSDQRDVEESDANFWARMANLLDKVLIDATAEESS